MNGTFWLPEGASTLAPSIDSLFYFVTWASAILFVGVVVAVIYLAIQYRRRSPLHVPGPVEPNKVIEISWIVVPTILVLIIFVWGVRVYLQAYIPPPDSYEIQVRASAWRWDFEYPDGTQTMGELHVPVNRPVRLIMSSTDYLHSFFVPAFRVKMDVLPDRYTSVWFEATRPGVYQVYCAEYCGTLHSGMLATVIAQPFDEFEEWLQEAAIDEDMPLPELGALLYERQLCVQCHSVDGTPGVGPTFQGLYGSVRTMTDGTTAVADENYLRQQILDPRARIVAGYAPVMPTIYDALSERELSGLIAFIRGLE